MHRGIMGQCLHSQRMECPVVSADNLFSALQHTLIALHLGKTHGRSHIRHVALIPRTYNIMLPGTQLGFC